jgi:membrane-bound lytic murein transglycosylase F
VTHGLADLTAFHSTGIISPALVPGPTYHEAELDILCPKIIAENLNDLPVIVLDKDDSFAIRDELISRRWKTVRSTKHSLHTLLKLNLKSSQNYCYLAQDSEARFELAFFPHLKIQSRLSFTQPLRFWLNNKDPRLVQALFYWNQKISQDGTLSRIQERYSRGFQALSTADLQLFFDSIDDEFRSYESLFKKTAIEQRVPWQLIAAVSFQESHWNHTARSYTGVRGLMMLTEDTAEHMGITDRKDPEQSILGGARYLRFLLKMQPSHLAFRERLALALAAYNIGHGHLRDAQRLAVQLGKSPFAWKDLREVLPLLAEERWSQNLDFGDARGQETVDFTERVLAYYELMSFHP